MSVALICLDPNSKFKLQSQIRPKLAGAIYNGILRHASADGVKYPDLRPYGGDLASTRVVQPKVHAELQIPRKTDCKLLVANDDNYALAA